MDLNCRNITNINKSSDKNLFLKDLSVELVNTINVLDGFLNLLNKEQLSDRDKELLSQAKYASFLLAHQVKALHYIQETEKIAPKINFINLNLYEIIVNSLSFFKNEFSTKSYDIIFSFDENIPKNLCGDSLKINELVNCLIENLFILSDNKVNILVNLVKDEQFKKLIRFDVTFDSEILSNLFVNTSFENFIYENISFKSNIKKVDINFAISNELLDQLGSKLVYTQGVNNSVNIMFDLEFSVQED